MTTNQPKWKLVQNLGDVHLIDHGGYFVFEDTTGTYAPEAEILEPPDDDTDPEDDRARWTVYRFVLEPCTYEHGVLSDNPFHKGIAVWFAGDDNRASTLRQLANFTGIGELELINSFCSQDPIVRAHVWRIVGDYHGFENLDAYPLKLTRSEVTSRYSGIL